MGTRTWDKGHGHRLPTRYLHPHHFFAYRHSLHGLPLQSFCHLLSFHPSLHALFTHIHTSSATWAQRTYPRCTHIFLSSTPRNIAAYRLAWRLSHLQNLPAAFALNSSRFAVCTLTRRYASTAPRDVTHDIRVRLRKKRGGTCCAWVPAGVGRDVARPYPTYGADQTARRSGADVVCVCTVARPAASYCLHNNAWRRSFSMARKTPRFTRLRRQTVVGQTGLWFFCRDASHWRLLRPPRLHHLLGGKTATLFAALALLPFRRLAAAHTRAGAAAHLPLPSDAPYRLVLAHYLLL